MSLKEFWKKRNFNAFNRIMSFEYFLYFFFLPPTDYLGVDCYLRTFKMGKGRRQYLIDDSSIGKFVHMYVKILIEINNFGIKRRKKKLIVHCIE